MRRYLMIGMYGMGYRRITARHRYGYVWVRLETPGFCVYLVYTVNMYGLRIRDFIYIPYLRMAFCFLMLVRCVTSM